MRLGFVVVPEIHHQLAPNEHPIGRRVDFLEVRGCFRDEVFVARVVVVQQQILDMEYSLWDFAHQYLLTAPLSRGPRAATTSRCGHCWFVGCSERLGWTWT